MDIHHDAERLISELLSNPDKFTDDGRAYDLLQLYFRGAPLEALGSLVSSSDVLVRRAGLFVASELGRKARALLPDVLPLLGSEVRITHYDATEILTVCANADYAEHFAKVVS